MTTASISYSHESPEYKSKIRNIADTLRTDFHIDVKGDFYEEDMPFGKQMPSSMHDFIYDTDRVIVALTPQYKTKADDGYGGVGYEAMLITAEVYAELGSDKFVPVILDENKPEDFYSYFPKFMPPTRRGIFRFDYSTEAEFIEQIARVILKKPKKPKPPLGKASLIDQGELVVDVGTTDIELLVQNQNHKLLFDNALHLVKKGLLQEFRQLSREIKKLCFDNILKLREKHEASTPSNLTDIADEFIDAISPLYLICFAGYLSGNTDLSSQEGVMFDLLSLDQWNKRSGSTFVVIQSIPLLLVYVYHHVYGALHINRELPERVFDILEAKLPADTNRMKYDYLYRMHTVTGWIESLGRNCFDSFKYLLGAYDRWDWLKLLFRDEAEYKENLTIYQLMIHLLNFFYVAKTGGNEEMPYDIPPSFVVAGDYKRIAENWAIKNSKFFKSYINDKNLTKEMVSKSWDTWKNGFGQFRLHRYYYSYLPDSFMNDLLL